VRKTKEDGSIVIYGESWSEIGFPRVNTNRGDTKHKGCPVCEESKGKTNSPDVSINGAKGYGHCFSCGTKFAVGVSRSESHREESKHYEAPSLGKVQGLSEDATEFLRGRRISSLAISRAKLVEERGSILFPYTKDGVLVNAKYRGISEKTFRQAAGAMPIMYLYDFCKGKKRIIVTEGEFDALSWLTALIDQGVDEEYGVTSVNAGAPNENDTNVEKKLECVTNSIELFEEAEIIYLCVDNDPNGRRLQKELIRRFDEDKVRLVDLGECKDANEFHIKHDHLDLLALLETATVYVPEGIYTSGGSKEDIKRAFREGFVKGSTTYFPSVDERWTWRTGDVSIWTGYNNDGKSMIVNQLATLKGKYDGWKTGIWSPENLPLEKFWLNLAHPFIGKPFIDGPNEKMTEEELDVAIDFFNDMFYLIDPEDYRIGTVLDRMNYLIRVYGIRIVILDPFNQIEHEKKRNETTDEYISRFMTILKRFAVKYDVSVIMIAHQNPPKNLTSSGDYPRPDKYTIKNGGTFPDKADHVIAPHRPFYKTDPKNPDVDICALKLKDIGLIGELGVSGIQFDRISHRYKDPELGWRSPFDTIKIEEEQEILVPVQADMFGDPDDGSIDDVPF
jgi:twinkle protein